MSEPANHPTAAIITLGCKLNIADSEAMAVRLRSAGWRVVQRATPDADAVIVNSCTVTSTADRKSRQLALAARRIAPDATVAFTGCMVETAGNHTLAALGVDLISRQHDQAQLADSIIELRPRSAPLGAVVEELPLAPALKTRAFISAQEGCDDVCAFCVIPRTRGRERSKPVDAILEEAQRFESEGAQEIVITGTQLGAYGRELGSRMLDRVIEALLTHTSVPRIRISSVQPQDLSPSLIDLWQDPRLCRHFHLALQSGSATVLQRMRRRYTRPEYAAAVHSLRAAMPGVAITTDVIAGFPGETQAEFDETFEFCREMSFAAMHVFPYSDRPHTSADRLPDKIGDATKKERVHRLIDLGSEMSRAYRASFAGHVLPVLWETQTQTGAWEGLTDTYIRVRGASDRNLHNLLTPVRLTGLSEDGLLGEVVDE
jgi:threonylcarbamoyladenosine tRNA methylthiotransferase MtaB